MSFVLLVGLVITLVVVIAARRQRRARITTIETRPANPSVRDNERDQS